MEHTKQLLVKQKMDTLFSYLNEKDSATQFKKRLEEYLDQQKQNQDYLDFYNKFHNNMSREELIKRQIEKIYEIKGRMKESLEEYNKDNLNKSAMNNAINIHKTELIPEMLSFRRLKYYIVEMNDDILNEKEYPISSFVDQISSPEVVKFIMN
jgi:exonuclease VII large subunit